MRSQGGGSGFSRCLMLSFYKTQKSKVLDGTKRKRKYTPRKGTNTRKGKGTDELKCVLTRLLKRSMSGENLMVGGREILKFMISDFWLF